MKTHCLSNSEIEERLKRAGVSATAQRIFIARYVLCGANHPTAEQVKAWVDKNFPKMSMATVYNTLGTLVKAGLLKEIRLPHRESVMYDQNVEEHFHFVDEDSGDVTDIHESYVSLKHRLSGRFEINEIEVIFKGKKKN